MLSYVQKISPFITLSGLCSQHLTAVGGVLQAPGLGSARTAQHCTVCYIKYRTMQPWLLGNSLALQIAGLAGRTSHLLCQSSLPFWPSLGSLCWLYTFLKTDWRKAFRSACRSPRWQACCTTHSIPLSYTDCTVKPNTTVLESDFDHQHRLVAKQFRIRIFRETI